MDHQRSSTLLDEALALDWTHPRVILIEDCVETNGAFLLHHLLKRSLALHTSTSAVIFLALSQSLSHYDRILRKMVSYSFLYNVNESKGDSLIKGYVCMHIMCITRNMTTGNFYLVQFVKENSE